MTIAWIGSCRKRSTSVYPLPTARPSAASADAMRSVQRTRSAAGESAPGTLSAVASALAVSGRRSSTVSSTQLGSPGNARDMSEKHTQR